MIQVIQKVLYVLNDDVYLSLQGDAIVITQDNIEKLRLPLSAVGEIVLFGSNTISNRLIQGCSAHKIILSYVNPYGHFLGRFYGCNVGNVFLRKKQYEFYDNEENSLALVKNIMLSKFLNQVNLLKYYSRSANDKNISSQLYASATSILEQSKKIKDVQTIDELRWLEGAISAMYFSQFDLLLKSKDINMRFECRSKNPPLNNCNALLSLFYTLYTMNITAALESFGLDSQLGYMHRMRSGRPSLSCDVIEEFRSPIIDKFVIKTINLSQVSSKDFEKTEDGIKLKPESLRKVLQLWEAYKEDEIYHPFLKKNVKIKLLPFIQSQLLAQYIRGDIEQYPAFYFKLS